MTPETSKRLVLLSMMVVAAVDVAGGGSGTFRRVWNAGVVGLLLSVAADFAPSVAGPFAVLVTLGVLTGPGQKTINGLLSGVEGALGAAPGASASPGGGAATMSAAPPPYGTTTPTPNPRTGMSAPVQITPSTGGIPTSPAQIAP